MGIFNRNRNTAATANGTGNVTGTERREKRTHHHHPEDGHLNRRPSFGQWLKATWLDLITMVCMGVIGLGVYEAHPAASRSFPIAFADGEVVYPEFA